MNNRYIVRALAFMVLLALVSVALLGCGSGSVQQSGQQTSPQAGVAAQPTPTPGPHESMFPGMEGIPPDEMFDHFLGGQFRMTDKDGTPFTVTMTPGTVNSVSATSITITPNGQTDTQAFNITPDTIVRAAPERGKIEAIAVGDKVVVVTRDEGDDAVMIAKHGQMFHKRMMDSMLIE